MKASSLSRARRSATPSLPHESSTNVKKKMRVQEAEAMKGIGELFRSLPRKSMNRQAPLEKEETPLARRNAET
jgi:hypothetical protein